MQMYVINDDENMCKPRQILIILSQVQVMVSYTLIMMKCIQRMRNRKEQLI